MYIMYVKTSFGILINIIHVDTFRSYPRALFFCNLVFLHSDFARVCLAVSLEKKRGVDCAVVSSVNVITVGHFESAK